MGSKQDAEDATQSVFMKLMASHKSFADNGHEKAWLITTARNHCRDMHRKWWRRKVVDLDSYAVMGDQGEAFRHIDSDLAGKLRKLPAMHRLILYLHYYEGYKVAEIASMLKLNLNTVKMKMRSARKQLKLEMEEDEVE
ncbi:MAG: sigma-70 family polymerase sigma factor [Paenibacillaceae bacterium]|jgi:RNA polymerase sigma-70 factor (ECF subfamily)|nr:sigma-70 family polymerase sigma factor [Paenibacillaceae bacterium]